MVVGTSADYSYILEAGFWSHIGTRLHPVLLMVDPDAGDASLPFLHWTGSEAPFIVRAQNRRDKDSGLKVGDAVGVAFADGALQVLRD